jgi:hypothetical protein
MACSLSHLAKMQSPLDIAISSKAENREKVDQRPDGQGDFYRELVSGFCILLFYNKWFIE